LQRYQTMNPAQVSSLQTTVKHQRELATEAANLREKQAIAAQREAEAYAKRKEAAGGGVSPETVDFYARQSLAGDNAWKTGLGRSKTGQAIIAAVESRVPKIAGERNITPEQAAVRRDERAALSASLKDRTKYVAASNQFVSNFTKQADIVEKYMKPGIGGQSPVINRWIQAGRKSIAGDPDVTALDTAIRVLAREHQRIVTGVTSNAQLHASAQETADQLLNISQSPQQVRAALKVMREEAKNARESGLAETKNLRSQLENLGQEDQQKSETQKLSGEDQKAVDWAKAHPNDPRAKNILKLHGM